MGHLSRELAIKSCGFTRIHEKAIDITLALFYICIDACFFFLIKKKQSDEQQVNVSMSRLCGCVRGLNVIKVGFLSNPVFRFVIRWPDVHDVFV